MAPSNGPTLSAHEARSTTIASLTAPALPRRQRGPAKALTYGYHNTFHTHATDQPPPCYQIAKSASFRELCSVDESDSIPPEYTCSVYAEGPVGLRCEKISPFLVAPDERWYSMYAVLRGTRLDIHRVKSDVFPAYQHSPRPGRLLKSYTMQHAEVGIAVDACPAEASPRYTFVKILPSRAKEKLWRRNPILFYLREWMIRLRVEGEQFLLGFESQNTMLNWIEDICSAIDISPPLEDRSEPRYRSLPRRTRRQRQLEASANGHQEEAVETIDDFGARLVAQQDRLLRTMYPNLASGCLDEARENDSGARRDASFGLDLEQITSQDPDSDDLDPADATEAQFLSNVNTRVEGACGSQTDVTVSSGSLDSAANSKSSARQRPLSSTAVARYRRRCAPILHKSSPRASDIIIHKGRRMRIDAVRERLLPFELLTPRYGRGSSKHIELVVRRTEEAEGNNDAARPVSRASTIEGGDARTENEQDAASVHSTDLSDAITPTVSSPYQRDQLLTVNPSDSMATQIKEKTASLVRRRQHRADEDAARVFTAGVVCWGL
jgi:hypothetical protein